MFALIEDAKKQFPRLWSVRLSILAGLLSSADAAVDAFTSGKTSFAAIAVGLIAFAASFARIVDQPALREEVAASKAADA